MTLENFLKFIKSQIKTLVMWGLLLAAASFLFLIVTQKNFKSSMDLLVVQNQNGFTDYYALSKSADFLTGVLTESIYSEKFLDEIGNAGVATDAFLPNNKIDRLKDWEKMVKISRNPSLGTIHIEVFADTQKQVDEISNAIVTVLTTKNFLFLGNGQDLDVRVLNSPIWEKNPSIADIVLASIGGFAAGVLIALAVSYYKEEKNKKRYAHLISVNDDHIESLEYLEK